MLRIVFSGRPSVLRSFPIRSLASKTTETPTNATQATETSASVDNALQSLMEDGAALTIHSATSSSAPTAVKPSSLGELPPAYVTSGVPDLMVTKKTARIFRPAQNAMQSGGNEGRFWQLDMDTEDKWENPLMGYVSSADPVQSLRMRFHEKEDAILFAEKQGWDYIVQEDQQPAFRKKSYADNYKFSSGKLRLQKTKLDFFTICLHTTQPPQMALGDQVGFRDHYKGLRSYLGDLRLQEQQMGISSQRQSAREKLTRLGDNQFHELCTDVFDELDRRLRGDMDEPFLSVKAEFHPKRNQARQKLATLSEPRFKDLAGDVFSELERRRPELASMDGAVPAPHLPRALPTATVAASPMENAHTETNSPRTAHSKQTAAAAPATATRNLGARGSPPQGFHPIDVSGKQAQKQKQDASEALSLVNFQTLDNLMADLGSLISAESPAVNNKPNNVTAEKIVPVSTGKSHRSDSRNPEGSVDIQNENMALKKQVSDLQELGTTLKREKIEITAERDKLLEQIALIKNDLEAQSEHARLKQEEYDHSEKTGKELNARIAELIAEKEFSQRQYEQRIEQMEVQIADAVAYVKLVEQQREELGELREELERAKLEVEELRADKEDLLLKKKNILADMEAKDGTIATRKKEVAQLQSEISNLQEQNAKFREENVRLKKDHAAIAAENSQLEKDIARLKNEDGSSAENLQRQHESPTKKPDLKDKADMDDVLLDDEPLSFEKPRGTSPVIASRATPTKTAHAPPKSPPVDFASSRIISQQGLLERSVLTAFQDSAKHLLQASKKEAPPAVLLAMKAIVVATRSIAENLERYEPMHQSSEEKIDHLKREMSTTLKDLMSRTKAHATTTDSTNTETSATEIESSLHRLSKVIFAIVDVVKVRPDEASSNSNQSPTSSPIVDDRHSWNQSDVNPPVTTIARQPSPKPTSPLKEPVVKHAEHAVVKNVMSTTVGSSKSSPGYPHEELKVFLEQQTDLIVQNIQKLLQSMRQSSFGKEFKDNITGISIVAENLIIVAQETLSTAKEQRRVKGEAVLQKLINSNQELITLGDAVRPPDQIPSKQKLAAAAYEVAKNTKELVAFFDT